MPSGGCSTRFAPDKDVDGFHPINVGRLVQNRATLVACTPSGVIELLERSNIAIAGTRAVVIGRSDIVGKPMALLLLHRHATVTICHSKTPNLPAGGRGGRHPRRGDRPAGIRDAEFVKPGATVVDVGTTPVTDRAVVERLFPPGSKRREAFERRGSLVVGDVHPGRGRGRRRAVAGARRRRPADDRDAAEEHAARRRARMATRERRKADGRRV